MEQVSYLTKPHSGCRTSVKLKSATMTLLVSEAQRAGRVRGVSSGPFMASSSELMETLHKYVEHGLYPQVTAVTPGRITMDRCRLGRSPGSLWAAWSVLGLDLGGGYKDTYTCKNPASCPLKGSALYTLPCVTKMTKTPVPAN